MFKTYLVEKTLEVMTKKSWNNFVGLKQVHYIITLATHYIREQQLLPY